MNPVSTVSTGYYSLRWKTSDFHAALDRLIASPRQPQQWSLHTACTPQGADLLVAAGGSTYRRLRLRSSASPGTDNLARMLPSDAELVIGLQDRRGHAEGFVWVEGHRHHLAEIYLVGAGMIGFSLLPSAESPQPAVLGEDTLYDRLTGVFGEAQFQNLQHQRIGLIGAGGIGSIFADSLGRLLGASGRLVIVDPDTLQAPNLIHWAAAHGQSRQTLGSPKAEVLTRYLSQIPDPPELITVSKRVTGWDALRELLGCDLWICAVDNPLARFVTSALATFYRRPLLDVATGIHLGDGPASHREQIGSAALTERLPRPLREGGARYQAADLRLTIPDVQNACLLCLSGVGSLHDVHLPAPVEEPYAVPSLPSPFWRERAGSLWSLNNEAVSRALRLLLAFLGGHVEQSTHLQLDDTGDGMGEWRRVAPDGQWNCPICSHEGQGDSALPQLYSILAEARRAQAHRQDMQ